MEVNIDDLEIELSDVSVRILDLMSQYVACKVNIEQYIKAGCLDLAKARYILGNKSISSLQLPTEENVGVTAQFKVTVEENSEGKLKCEHYKIPVDSNVILRGKSFEKEFPKEPLKWFGVLVPQSLRRAQTTFQNSLEIIIENTNIQLDLHRYMNKYEELKHHLEKLHNTN